MSILALTGVMVSCDGDNLRGKCHCDITTESDLVYSEITEETYMEWIEEEGWLPLLDGTAYCPECRVELHEIV